MTVSGSKIYDETYNISYDAQSRITLMQSTSNAGNKFVYSYKASSYSITLYISNMLSNYGEYFLAANKTIDSSLQYNDSKDTTTEKYSYNAKGQIEKVLQYEYSTAKGSVLYDIFLYTYDAKGNITKEERSMSTTTYTYYDDLKTPFNFLVPYHTTNPNLPKTETNNGIAMTYKYTFDSKGRLVQTEGTSNVGEMVEITKYTY